MEALKLVSPGSFVSGFFFSKATYRVSFHPQSERSCFVRFTAAGGCTTRGWTAGFLLAVGHMLYRAQDSFKKRLPKDSARRDCVLTLVRSTVQAQVWVTCFSVRHRRFLRRSLQRWIVGVAVRRCERGRAEEVTAGCAF